MAFHFYRIKPHIKEIPIRELSTMEVAISDEIARRFTKANVSV